MIRHAPFLALFYVSDILIPFMLIAAFASWGQVCCRGDPG